jgi:hypothetical protein
LLRRIAKEEHGRVLKPPTVPFSISLVNVVVKVNTPVKKSTIQRVAELASTPIDAGEPQAILAMIIEVAAKNNMESIS